MQLMFIVISHKVRSRFFLFKHSKVVFNYHRRNKKVNDILELVRGLGVDRSLGQGSGICQQVGTG